MLIRDACRRSGRIGSDVHIIGASKAQSVDTILEAVKAGIKAFGENYVQELISKTTQIDDSSIEWHFIGHLQRNKVKQIIDKVTLIHSVDSVALAAEISKNAVRLAKVMDVLLQVNSSGENSKSGISPDSLMHLAEECSAFEGVRIRGLMAVPEATDDEETLRGEFRLLRTLRDAVRDELAMPHCDQLSMGMSSDYEIAVEEGATMVRLGTILFGERHYA